MSVSKEPPAVKRSKTRVRDLQSKLAQSVPRTELETLKASLEAKIGDLEAKLGQSLPKDEVDPLRARLGELESRLAESIPKREAEAELESVKSKLIGEAQELERKLAGSRSMVDSMRADLAQLQGRLAESTPKAESEAKLKEVETNLLDARRDLELARATTAGLDEKFSQSSAKINELQSKLSNSVPATELETIRNELQSKITDLEEKLSSSVPRNEADELRARVVQLEGELSRSASKADADALAEKANRLESALTEASEKLSSAETRIRDLESRLTESTPKADAETMIEELQARLSASKGDADALKEKLAGLETIRGELQSKIADLEEKLAVSVPRSEADALSENANRLEAALTEALDKQNSAEARSRDLEARLGESKSETDVLKEKIARAPGCLMNYIKAWLSLYTFYYDLIRRHQNSKPYLDKAITTKPNPP